MSSKEADLIAQRDIAVAQVKKAELDINHWKNEFADTVRKHADVVWRMDGIKGQKMALRVALKNILDVLDREWPQHKEWRLNSPEAKPFRDAITLLEETR